VIPESQRRWLRRLWGVAALLLALGISGAGWGLLSAAPQEQQAEPLPPTEIPEHQVMMQGKTFMPAELTVPAGTVVTWFNRDGEDHDVIEYDVKWESPLVNPGAHYSRLFDTPGAYKYICDLHANMEGMLIVTAPVAPAAEATAAAEAAADPTAPAGESAAPPPAEAGYGY
jgi:plastocyanin